MFEFVRSLSGENFQTPIVLPTTASEVYTDTEGLVVTNGTLTKVGATAAPTYICGEAYTAPSSGNRSIAVYPVLPHHVYKTTFAADASAVAEGAKVTLHTDGAQITATTASGVATIVKKLGTGAVGTEALVRFI
jgi:hypothetical protein